MSGCSPLEQDIVDKLAISLDGTRSAKPGDTFRLTLGTAECCSYIEPLPACADVSWSLDQGAPAAIDPDTGEVTIDSDAADDAVIVATANVENGRKLVAVRIYVYTDETDPLFGIWTEDVQFACDDGAELQPSSPIGELDFRADGGVNVTWTPFETYVDYWSDFELDLEAETLALTVIGGNYVPEDIDSEGNFEIDEQGRLVLEDMWLGSPAGSTAPANCGHRFVRP